MGTSLRRYFNRLTHPGQGVTALFRMKDPPARIQHHGCRAGQALNIRKTMNPGLDKAGLIEGWVVAKRKPSKLAWFAGFRASIYPTGLLHLLAERSANEKDGRAWFCLLPFPNCHPHGIKCLIMSRSRISSASVALRCSRLKVSSSRFWTIRQAPSLTLTG